MTEFKQGKDKVAVFDSALQPLRWGKGLRIRSLAGFCSFLFLVLVIVSCSDVADSSSRIPFNTGPLSPRVLHPEPGAQPPSSGFDYVMGAVGSGRAMLLIDGTPVRVMPNGAFLAYLQVPNKGARGYSLTAILGRDTVRWVHPIAPASAVQTPLRRQVDSTSIFPKGRIAVQADDLVPVQISVPPGASAWVQQGTGTRVSPILGNQQPATSDPRIRFRDGTSQGDQERSLVVLPARDLDGTASIVVARGNDTVRVLLPEADTTRAIEGWGVIGQNPPDNGEDRELVGRFSPTGPYDWFFLPGTKVRVTGRYNDQLRVVASGITLWTAARDVQLAATAPAETAIPVGSPSLERTAEWIEVTVPMAEPPVYRTVERADGIDLLLFGVRPETDFQQPIVVHDSWLRELRQLDTAKHRIHYRIRLAGPLYGYRMLWENGELKLRLRRPPRANPRHPLRGLTIAVDAGHPPGGAVGPTGLLERDVTMETARRLKRLLNERGAIVIMTRANDQAVSLERRSAITLLSNAHAFVSIHTDAVPSGANPYSRDGTATYVFHSNSIPLARSVQRGLLRRMRLPDFGIRFGNFAVLRSTWLPAVLCEGATLTLPEREAALRTRSFQEAYALGIANGLEQYFRSLGPGKEGELE